MVLVGIRIPGSFEDLQSNQSHLNQHRHITYLTIVDRVLYLHLYQIILKM